jgi:NAD(P)H-hydrate epimerase
MTIADRRAVEAGVPSLVLMENAGRAVAEAAARMVPPGVRIAVLCGPGNNGGDGFVAARLLASWGYPVALSCTVSSSALKGDAAVMAARWEYPVGTTEPSCIAGAALVVDALYGAGIARPIEGAAAEVVLAANAARAKGIVHTLAIDVPSGLDGTSGAVRGAVAIEADRTVTFFRRKPGHLLQPGRRLSGCVQLADIGLPTAVLEARTSQVSPGGRLGSAWANAPSLWLAAFPRLGSGSHKYTRGHAVVVSGPAHATGAARLGARGALRAGAGLVTVAAPDEAVPVVAAQLTAIMVAPFAAPGGLSSILADMRRNAVLIGPGAGVGADTRALVAQALASPATVVLDADALTSFADGIGKPGDLFNAIRRQPVSAAAGGASRTAAAVVLTPHEGEFRRLFGPPPAGTSKLDRARAAASACGAVVILKGPDTVVAAPDGRATINENAPPWLATAGSGDVLAGIVTGLVAQGMPAFEAAAAAVWLHGEAGMVAGPGLVAEDIPEVLGPILRSLSQAGSVY